MVEYSYLPRLLLLLGIVSLRDQPGGLDICQVRLFDLIANGKLCIGLDNPLVVMSVPTINAGLMHFGLDF